MESTSEKPHADAPSGSARRAGAWHWSDEPAAYAAAAGPFLRADPVGNTISLTVMANAVEEGGPADTLFGWWTDSRGDVSGAVSLSGRYRVLLAAAPDPAAAPLVEDLLRSGRLLTGVVGPSAQAAQVATLWRARTGGEVMLDHAMRLYRLERLLAPPRSFPGRIRPATAADEPVVTRLVRAFNVSTGSPVGDTESTTRRLLSYGGAVLAEVDDEVVAVAATSRVEAAMARIAYVYTPPEHRNRGYAGAVTAAATQLALQRGAEHVVLFTDLGNPVTNALYPRLGFQPVEDRLAVDFRSVAEQCIDEG